MKLKPCPFCGSESVKSIYLGVSNKEGDQVAIECEKCKARGPIGHIQDNREYHHHIWWNERNEDLKYKKIFDGLVIECISYGDQKLWNYLYPYIKYLDYKIDKNIIDHFSMKLNNE